MCDSSPGGNQTKYETVIRDITAPRLHEIRKGLRDGSFWLSYNIKRSPGDGHCFVHSVKSSLNSQLGVDITIDKLRVLIRNETVSNINESLTVVDENSQNVLMKGLYNYFERKMYDSTYGNMVPEVTANGFDVNSIIVENVVMITYVIVLAKMPTCLPNCTPGI